MIIQVNQGGQLYILRGYRFSFQDYYISSLNINLGLTNSTDDDEMQRFWSLLVAKVSGLQMVNIDVAKT